MDLVHEMYRVPVNWHRLLYFPHFSEDHSVLLDILRLLSGIFRLDVGDIHDYCPSSRGRAENDKIFSGKARFLFLFHVFVFLFSVSLSIQIYWQPFFNLKVKTLENFFECAQTACMWFTAFAIQIEKIIVSVVKICPDMIKFVYFLFT